MIISSSQKMATVHYIRTWFWILILMASSSAATSNIDVTTDLARAIEEMQRANYFTFVVLIDLAPPELIQGNLTFLMPKDKTLSRNSVIRQSSISDFLLRHSIPSPLLFEHLQRFPTGSSIPTSMPGVFLNITNYGGRRSFFLNNVRITSPNICISGSSIRCHGIDGVIQPLQLPATPAADFPPLPPPLSTPPYHHTSTKPPPPPPLSTTPSHGAVAGTTTPPATPSPPPSYNISNHLHKSGSGRKLATDFTHLISLTISLMFLALKLST